MQSKYILFLALVSSGSLFGCSTAFHPTASRQTDMPPLYVYWGSEAYDSASRFLSARIHLDEDIYVGGDDFLELKGHIERRGTNLVADLVGSTGQQAQFYRGNMALEKPFYAQGGAASGGAGPPFWFLLSTNSDCRTILEHVNTARGLTNTPFNHPALILTPPAMSHSPELIDPATGLPWNNSKLDPNTGLPMSQKQDEGAQAYFEDILAKCGTNEIRCLWFLNDNPKVGFVMVISLDEESVSTARDVYNWAIQNSETRELSDSQVLKLKTIISSLPASDKNADFSKSVFVSIRNGKNVEVFQYDRQHVPGGVQRIYDIGGGYLN